MYLDTTQLNNVQKTTFQVTLGSWAHKLDYYKMQNTGEFDIKPIVLPLSWDVLI